MSGKANRTRGHNLERLIAKTFRELGYDYAKTTRSCSKLLDECGIDIGFVPFLIQCKAGYKNNRPKFEVEYNNIKTMIAKNFPPDHHIHALPIVLIHKLSGRKPEEFQWTFMHSDIIKLIRDMNKMKSIIRTVELLTKEMNNSEDKLVTV